MYDEMIAKIKNSQKEVARQFWNIYNQIGKNHCLKAQICLLVLFRDETASQMVLVVRIPACQCRRHKRCRFNPWIKKIPCRRAGQPTEKFCGQRSLVGYSLQGCKESDTTEATQHTHTQAHTQTCTDTHTYTHHIFCIHSCIDGHLHCFHVLAIINKATISMLLLLLSHFSRV